MAISPWVVGFNSSPTLAVSNLVTGIALAVLALGYAAAYSRTHALAWVAPMIGAWTIVTPWVILGGDSTTAIVVNNVITGGVVTLLGVGVAALSMTATSRR